MNRIIPLLIDFDGVLKVDGKPAAGIQSFFSFIKDENIPAIILSNSTRLTGSEVLKFFEANKIDCNLIAFTAVDAALVLVKKYYRKIKVYCVDEVKNLFNEFNSEKPEAVLVGDLGNHWTFETLNEIFLHIKNGAKLIALQKNKFWKNENGDIQLDAGAFISAIEFAADIKAELIGKPSPFYFESALQKLGYNLNDNFFMLGDDLYSDIEAAQTLGGKGILIYTGKTNYPIDSSMKIKPDYEAFDLADASQILERNFH